MSKQTKKFTKVMKKCKGLKGSKFKACRKKGLKK